MNVLALQLEQMGSVQVVRVLVDGRPLGEGGAREPYEAADLLGARALIPHDPPRRVSLAQCECGGGGGCTNHAVLIARAGDVVTWSDPRNVHGYYGHSLENQKDLDDDEDLVSEPLRAPTLTFDADAYLATVEDTTAAAERRQ